ncbi:MAG TPA: hypothetical protein VIR03_01710 [Candidatus Saccharimonadales bacterium]
MMRTKRFILALGAFLIIAPLIGSATVFVQQASAAASCSDPVAWFGRARWCGYFYNRLEQFGPQVRIGGVPGSVNTAQAFIDMVMGDLGSGNAQRVTEAQFVILTMIGRGSGLPKSVSAAQINDWQSRVRSYANLSENGTTSSGSNGRIDWFVSSHWACGTRNTFYQATFNDIAPYIEAPSNGNCAKPINDVHIYFRDASGAIIYVIRRACMNPLGQIGPLSSMPVPNFNLTPAVNVTVNGGAASSAQVGDVVQFTYVVANSGSTASTNVGCSTYANVHSGYYAASGAPAPGGSPGPDPECPRVFNVGSTTLASETITIATTNQTICRSLFVNPATLGGGERGVESCVIVAAEPYFKVFGGDISAGNGLATAPSTCVSNTNAAIISWNRRASAGYAGAGAQYAAYALETITDFASAQNLAGGAAEPVGLSFANTSTNVGVGNFGGSFGSASCIPDYYSRMPATGTRPLPGNVSSMTNGAYYSASSVNPFVGGNVNPNNKISVYVNGDVFISSDITYTGAWNLSSTPLFELVVRGNIYISSNVHRLDGVYIAQANGASGGTIYTCATTAAPIALTDGAFYNTCNSKLAVNGAFVANSVELLRTAATLQQATAAETSNAAGAGNNAAEIFNFSPSVWMVQPLDTSGTVDNYDAITSLPPVL